MKNLEIKNVDCHATLAMTENTQSGRSMIEMLGVLAIIGVLSVGGIAGYSKAMMKYRVNKTIEQISLIASNIQTFYSSQQDFSSLNCSCVNNNCAGFDSGCCIIKKAKLVPDEMLTIDSDGKITSITQAFGGDVLIEVAWINKKIYGIALRNLPDQACIEIASQDWNSISASGYKAITIDNKGTSAVKTQIGDMADYIASAECSYNVGDEISFACGKDNVFLIEDAVKACSCKDNTCTIGFAFGK